MAGFKVFLVCSLLVLSVTAQKEKKKASGATNTRGNFGFNNQFRPGGNVGLGGNFGGRPTGAYPSGVGAVGVGGLAGIHAGLGGGVHGGGIHGGGVHGGGIHGGGIHGGGIHGGGIHGGGIHGGGIHGGGLGGGIHGGGLGGGIHGGGLGGVAAPASCRYWCKTPEGQAYCCEESSQPPKHPITTQVVKPGKCPPVRAVCPLRSFGGPPKPCSKHGDCAHSNRCCYDRCLQEHVCKPPVY